MKGRLVTVETQSGNMISIKKPCERELDNEEYRFGCADLIAKLDGLDLVPFDTVIPEGPCNIKVINTFYTELFPRHIQTLGLATASISHSQAKDV